MVLSTKDIMDADKPVPVVNIPSVRLISATKKQGIICSIRGAWDPEILVAVITTVGVPVEEALADIVMKAKKLVIHMECDVEASLTI